MNNEPVAYGMLTFCKNCGEQNPYSAKTLTDEEILATFNPKFMCDLDDSDVIDFGRAILKKVQEK